MPFTCLLAALFAFVAQEPQPLVGQEQKDGVACAVRGTVLDAQMKAAAGICIGLVDDKDGDVAAALAQPITRTDESGGFRVDLQLSRQRSTWLVIGGGHHATQMCELATYMAPVLDLGPFAMAPGGNAAGRVRDRDGQPLEGARVVAVDLLDSRKFLPHRQGLRIKCRTVARTDRRGIFRLPGMVQSAGQLLVSKDGYYDELLQPVAIGEPLDVTLTPSPSVRGRVVGAEDAAVADATVRLGSAMAKTDAAGSFAVSLPSREVDAVRATKTIDGRVWWASEKIAAVDTELLLTLAPRAVPMAKTLPMRVVVRAPDGTPVPQFTAWVSWNPANQLAYRPDALLLAGAAKSEDGWCATAQDGTATIQGRPRSDRDDAAIVFVLAPGFAVSRVEATEHALGGEPIVVTLERQAVVRGRVVDTGSGKPIADAEVIPTWHLTDSERSHYGSGFRSVKDLVGAPTSTRTDQDGRYELRGMRAGEGDLFVHVPGRIELPSTRLRLADAEQRAGVDFAIPPNVPLVASLAATLPAGAQVRVHWHRPNMSSSAWPTEYDGAVPLAANGSFTIADLHPKPYEVQLLCAAPPRGGLRLKLLAGLWDGNAPPATAPQLPNPGPVAVTGKVGGAVPWHRLAVAALWRDRENSFRGDFAITGPIALVQPDRSFLLLGPRQRIHLLVFDVLTGVALEWQECDLDGAAPTAVFPGTAVDVTLALTLGTAVDLQGAACTVEYLPDPEHWPAGIGAIAPQRVAMATRTSSGMVTDARAGDTLDLWVPARTGRLRVLRGGQEMRTIELERAPAGPIEVDVGASTPR